MPFFCNNEEETIDCLFIECDLAYNNWSIINYYCPTQINMNQPIIDWLEIFGSTRTGTIKVSLIRSKNLLLFNGLFGTIEIIEQLSGSYWASNEYLLCNFVVYKSKNMVNQYDIACTGIQRNYQSKIVKRWNPRRLDS